MPGQIQALFNKHFTDKVRDFILLLQYSRDNSFSDNDIIEAYASLKARELRSISADQIKAMMHTNNEYQAIPNEPIFLDDIHKSGSALIEDGARKTHLSIGLGIKACLEDYTVFFTSVQHLLAQIRECRSQKSLRQLELRFQRYDMVFCDKFGYVSCDKEGGGLLSNHLFLRAGKKSIIITTKLAFDRWGEIVKDKVLIAAMIDRLMHKAYLINMNG